REPPVFVSDRTASFLGASIRRDELAVETLSQVVSNSPDSSPGSIAGVELLESALSALPVTSIL
ncbi:MAG: hypothetical protein MUC43_10350, partial [Pirellula sp.]|nr:hypothetical protein [Pirellula sp.]